MPANTLRLLSGALPVIELSGSVDAPISGIAYDSRDVRQGFLFVALSGLHTDGHRFIPDAIRRGAVGIMHSGSVAERPGAVGWARVADTRTVLSPLAAAFFGHPSRRLSVIGVTGTDGKSSTVWFIQQLLEALGKRSGFLSTVSFQTADAVVKNPFRQSTPEAPEIHGMLAEMADGGKEFAVVEATSHGLSARTNRLGDVLFDAAVMTNVTHEHLEFHGSFPQYLSDKANLFRSLSRSAAKPLSCPRFGVVNADDPNHDYFRGCTELPVFSYSARGASADLRARSVIWDISGCSFTIAHGSAAREARIRIPGPFWVENALAACLAVSGVLGADPLELAPLVSKLLPVKGRMENVDLGQPFSVIVDYAHTPGAFGTLMPWVRERTRGRLIAVFGSAGERDPQKRPMQGRAAAESCDILVLTDEDPRGEDRMSILEQIAGGAVGKRRGEELHLIPDRPAAIRLAFSLAREGDTVLLLGKGHEASIISSDGPREYDERTEAEKALREMGFGICDRRTDA
jgi:UDP-N-acetylmuramoyl-L-alanyl-D-glutamate--2,6-diaminopimelate ligase